MQMTFKQTIQIIFILLFVYIKAYSQSDSIVCAKKPVITFSSYLDVYYAYDFNLPKTSYRYSYFYNYNRHNELNLNLGIIKVNIDHPKYRANIALHVGTYVNDNYANNPLILHFQNLYENQKCQHLSKGSFSY